MKTDGKATKSKEIRVVISRGDLEQAVANDG